MTVGQLFSARPLLLAPMAGYSDAVFRQLCQEEGCQLAFTEMISAKGLLYGSEKSLLLGRPGSQEGPLGLQLFGNDPSAMGEAAALVTQVLGQELFCLDINCGCPARKIVTNGDGSALMLDLPLASRVIEAVVRHTCLPVSVKFRAGWDEEHVCAEDFAVMAEEAGAAFLTLHPRTRQQQYAGQADWRLIARVKQRVSVPVVGNGDVVDGASAEEMAAQTGCDGIMIGRGSLGKPWIFSQIRQTLAGQVPSSPSRGELAARILRHGELELSAKGPHGMVELRKHLPLYFSGMRHAGAWKRAVSQVNTLEDLRQLCRLIGEE